MKNENIYNNKNNMKKLTFNQFRSKLKGSGYSMIQVGKLWRQYPDKLSDNNLDVRIADNFNFDSVIFRENHELSNKITPSKYDKESSIYKSQRTEKINTVSLKDAKYIILDIETNGIGTFKPPVQKPIEIAFRVLSCNMELIYKYISFISPVKKINWGNEINCPYTVEEINKKGIKLEIVVEKLNKILHSEVYIVGHNIMFDIGCINYHSKIKLKDCKYFDTMKRSINICTIFRSNGKELKFPKLSELAEHFKIKYEYDKLHNAYYDVLITEKCLVCILKFLKENVSTFEYNGFHKYIKINSIEHNKQSDYFDNPRIFKNVYNK